MILNIVSAKYVAPLSVELQFSDGTVKIVDIGSFIKAHPHPQYNSYLDEKKFKRFKIEMGNIGIWFSQLVLCITGSVISPLFPVPYVVFFSLQHHHLMFSSWLK